QRIGLQERRLATEFAAEYEPGGTAGEGEDLRRVAVDVGGDVELAGLRVDERRRVDEVERRGTGPAGAEQGDRNAVGPGHGDLVDGADDLPGAVEDGVIGEAEAVEIAGGVGDDQVVQFVLVDVDMAVIDRDVVVPVVVEIALDAGDEAVGVAGHQLRTAA